MIWAIRRRWFERRVRKRMLHNLQVAAARRGEESHIDMLPPDQEALLQQYFGVRDSYRIERAAERWGVDIPTRPDWYSTEINKNEYASIIGGPDLYVSRWLNETGRSMLSRQIREARFIYWKGWADLLIPILALVVAALALFKDILVELVKKF